MAKLTVRPRRRWSEADLQEMVALLQNGLTVAQVAKRLTRSEAAIRVQATIRRVSASSDLVQREKRNQEFRLSFSDRLLVRSQQMMDSKFDGAV